MTMVKLPQIENTNKYVGLYVVDFGDHSGVGFTAEEVAELLDSERFRDIKVYKIYRALPDGRLELKGVPQSTFELESGMFFYAADEQAAQADFERLVAVAESNAPPGRAKVHLARLGERKYVVALVYPAEHDDQFSRWLLDTGYRTAGPAEGGTGAVQKYYDAQWQVLRREQLFGDSAVRSRTGEELLAAVGNAVQR